MIDFTKTLAAGLVASALSASAALSQVVTMATGAQGSFACNCGQAVANVGAMPGSP